MTTTIEIFDEDWSRLTSRKEKGDGFKDVVSRVLDQLEEAEAQGFVAGRDADDVDDDPEPEQRDVQEPVDDLDDPDGALHGEEKPLNVAGEGKSHPQTGFDEGDDTSDVVEELLDDWRPGRTREEMQDRRNVGEAALQLLIDDGGELTRADFVDELLPEYDVDDQNEKTWWKKSARPGLTRAVEAGLAERHHGPPHTYEWTGDDR